MAKGSNEISDQIVCQRTSRLDTLLLQRNRGGLRLADPYRQVAVTVGLPE